MDRKEKATALHSQGFNCAQSVVGAFDDYFQCDGKEILKIATGFGGGMGRGDVCGAVSGGIIVLSMVYGYGDEENKDKKVRTYDIVCRFQESFLQKHNSTLCRELLAGVTDGDRRRSICGQAITDAVEVVEKMLAEIEQ